MSTQGGGCSMEHDMGEILKGIRGVMSGAKCSDSGVLELDEPISYADDVSLRDNVEYASSISDFGNEDVLYDHNDGVGPSVDVSVVGTAMDDRDTFRNQGDGLRNHDSGVLPEQNRVERVVNDNRAQKSFHDAENCVDNASLLSQNNAQEAINEISSLLQTINMKKVQEVRLNSERDMTLDDVVTKAIMPYLSRWLNDNLSSIVHEIVEKEIKKLTGDS